jgi:hypothetical protein
MEFRLTIAPQLGRVVYGRSDRNGACPSRALSQWAEEETRLQHLGFVSDAIREAEKAYENGQSYTFRASWRAGYDNFWNG